MAMLKKKPTSSGRRFVFQISHAGLHKGPSYGPLTESKTRISGRNNRGVITVRRRGGGHKRSYRKIDFKRDKDDVSAVIERLEYDPNRTAFIALVLYNDGERRYIIAPGGVAVGTEIKSGPDVSISPGNALPMGNMPVGTTVHCVESSPGRGAQFMRSAGTSAQLVAKEGIYAILRMRSGEIRRVLLAGRATVGSVSNSENALRSLGKAGASRWRGRRPTVRGVAMNPVDHPHGGGEGRTSGGRHPVSPTGVPAKGYKTRSNKRTQKMIIRDRRKK